jgi:hypothetical protein
LNDRHVLAAAIHSRANAIITCNLSDFPAIALEPLGLIAIHPDDFVMQLIDEDEDTVCAAVVRQRAALRNPPQTVEELLATLEKQGLKKTAAHLRKLAASLE